MAALFAGAWWRCEAVAVGARRRVLCASRVGCVGGRSCAVVAVLRRSFLADDLWAVCAAGETGRTAAEAEAVNAAHVQGCRVFLFGWMRWVPASKSEDDWFVRAQS